MCEPTRDLRNIGDEMKVRFVVDNLPGIKDQKMNSLFMLPFGLHSQKLVFESYYLIVSFWSFLSL